MRILIITDKETSAIHKMAKAIVATNPHHEFQLVSCHPKRPNAEQLDKIEKGLKWCQIVDFQYWKSAEVVKAMFPISVPTMLTHHNAYDVDQHDWSEYNLNVVLNEDQKQRIKTPAKKAFHPVDIYYWRYENEDFFTKDRLNTVIMVSSRIEGKKGVLEVAEATEALGMKMILVGFPSDAEYLKKVLAHKNVDYRENVSDAELKALYYQSGIHVCNSIDNFESGTLPILEAMACGVPVLTRKIGHVPETYNGRNMVVRDGKPDDVEDLKANLTKMKEDYEWMCQLRKDAWYSIKMRNYEKFGRVYSGFYYSLLTNKLVSVIIPTYNRFETLKKTITLIGTQMLPHVEIVIADDGSNDKTALLQYVKELPATTIKYVKTDQYVKDGHGGFDKTYGLAHARNKAIMEAEGEYLLLLDDRIGLQPEAIEKFLERAKPNHWLWGEKDGVQKEFVENFSFVHRQTLIDFGMFPEVISQYGGMTQATKKRALKHGITFEFVSGAKANFLAKSPKWWRRWEDIAKSKTQCYKLGYE
jgi:glycosyltransferase involved in cell wall biosynthesis